MELLCDFLDAWKQMSSDEKDAFVKDHLCPEFPVVDGRQFVPTAELRIRGLLDILATQPGVLADKVKK